MAPVLRNTWVGALAVPWISDTAGDQVLWTRQTAADNSTRIHDVEEIWSCSKDKVLLYVGEDCPTSADTDQYVNTSTLGYQITMTTVPYTFIRDYRFPEAIVP